MLFRRELRGKEDSFHNLYHVWELTPVGLFDRMKRISRRHIAALGAVAAVLICLGALSLQVRPGRAHGPNENAEIVREYGALARPKAETTGVRKLISESLARAAVLHKAREKWERIAVGQPILCSDDNGKLVAYMFPVSIGSDVFPKDEHFLSRMNAGAKNGKAAIDWGTDKYWTYVVSARESDFPIPTYFNTLPPYLATTRIAAEKAKQFLGAANVELTRYYFLGHRGEYFEFSSRHESVLVHAYRLGCFSPNRILTRKGERQVDLKGRENRLAEEERKSFDTYREQTREEWQRLKALEE